MRTRLLKFIDKCRWCRDLYEAFTPWVQIAGFVILCAFTAGSAWAQFAGQQVAIDRLNTATETNAGRINVLENHYNRIDQKLDDITDGIKTLKKK